MMVDLVPHLTRAQAQAALLWQGDDWLHPLTCGKHSDRPLQVMRMEFLNEMFEMRCTHFECDYRQTWIPDSVMAYFLDACCEALGMKGVMQRWVLV